MTKIPHASEIETRIAIALIKRAIKEGYCLSVSDGESNEATVVLSCSTDLDAICHAMGSTDSDVLVIRHVATRARAGFVWLIWGNEQDLISDHTDNTDICELVAGL